MQVLVIGSSGVEIMPVIPNLTFEAHSGQGVRYRFEYSLYHL
jgi:hypothetical protein